VGVKWTIYPRFLRGSYLDISLDLNIIHPTISKKRRRGKVSLKTAVQRAEERCELRLHDGAEWSSELPGERLGTQ
jgi:hypothetical protein